MVPLHSSLTTEPDFITNKQTNKQQTLNRYVNAMNISHNISMGPTMPINTVHRSQCYFKKREGEEKKKAEKEREKREREGGREDRKERREGEEWEKKSKKGMTCVLLSRMRVSNDRRTFYALRTMSEATTNNNKKKLCVHNKKLLSEVKGGSIFFILHNVLDEKELKLATEYVNANYSCKLKDSTVTHAYNPRTLEAEESGSPEVRSLRSAWSTR
ncbi:hypothetical protein AAY473_000797 [Plecturocebus cupreus]